MWLDLFNLLAMGALTTYLLGVFVTVLWMAWRGLTPKHWGLQRPYTSEEYLVEPLAWPVVLIWWLVLRKSRL